MSIEYDYIQYLTDLVGEPVELKGKEYSRLINILYDTEFYYYINNDDNRAASGVSWRMEFARSYTHNNLDEMDEIANGILGSPCSFLEMLIGLADDISKMFIGHRGLDSIGYWFWKMISNCGLDAFSDDVMDPNFVEKVQDILTRIMDRRYSKSGRGGLFPLKNPSRDQTQVELWYQMLAYIEENYDI